MAAVFGNKPFTINDWHVDPASDRIMRGDHVIKLDPQNMKVLEVLASRAGEVISQAEIEESAWPGVVVTPNSVYQSIAQLRKALGDDRSSPKYIETIARKGYRCVAQVEAILASKNDLVSPECISTETRTHLHRQFERPSTRSTFRLAGLASLAVLTLGTLLYLVLDTDRAVVNSSSDATANNIITSPSAEKTSAVIRGVELARMGDAAALSGHPNQALRYYEEALLYASKESDDTTIRAQILAKAASAFLYKDDSRNAAIAARAAINLINALDSELHPDLIGPHSTLGEALLDLEDFEAAESHISKAINLALALYGRSDTVTLNARSYLVPLRLAQRRWAEAEQLAREILEEFTKVRGIRDLQGVQFRVMLARTLYHQDRFSESLKETQIAIDVLSQIARADDPNIGAAQQLLADNFVKIGEYAEAEVASRRSEEIWKQNDSPPWRIARARSTRGEALLKQGKLNEAASHLRFAHRILEGLTGYLQTSAREENDERIVLLSSAGDKIGTDKL